MGLNHVCCRLFFFDAHNLVPAVYENSLLYFAGLFPTTNSCTTKAGLTCFVLRCRFFPIVRGKSGKGFLRCVDILSGKIF